MIWERFLYACRLLAAGKNLESMNGAEHYGPAAKTSHPTHHLLHKLEALPETQRRSVAVDYSALRLSESLMMPPRLRRLLAYLALLALVYYWLAGVYYWQVLPSFVIAFEHFAIPPSEWFSRIQSFWYLPLLGVALVLLLALVATWQVRRLYCFTLASPLRQRFLLPASLRQHQAAIRTLLGFPLAMAQPEPGTRAQALVNHLQQLQRAGMPVGPELEALLRVESEHLSCVAGRYLQWLTALGGVVLWGCIFIFLAGVYAPIFVMGEVI